MKKTNLEIMDIVLGHLRFAIVFLACAIWFQAGQSCAANASTTEPKFKIAIIDTGYDIHAPGVKLKLCKTGHHDFKTHRDVINHTIEHGTLVASIIAERLKDVDYCAVIFQVHNRKRDIPDDNIVSALSRAKRLGVVAVNLSVVSQYPTVAEREALKTVATIARVFVAAGNERQDLDHTCDSFPTCYDIPNMVSVGALDPITLARAPYSNRGSRINLWYSGRYHTQDKTHEGTSFAAPRALSDYVLSLARPAPTNIKLPSVKPPMPTTNTLTLTTTSEN